MKLESICPAGGFLLAIPLDLLSLLFDIPPKHNYFRDRMFSELLMRGDREVIMRRWVIGCFIATYVSALGLGIGCQTLRMGIAMHPAMYFLVWDMYCGWAAYNHRYRAIAEGVSGTYYDLNPAPWGSFRPYDRLDRLQYVLAMQNQALVTRHVAERTEHEPFARMFIIEESWAKQFDLPEYIWKAHNAIPRSPHYYTKVVLEQAGDGQIVNIHPQWLDFQNHIMVADNPRLQESIRATRPFWVVDEQQGAGNRYFQNQESDSMSAVRAPSAN